jgi:hypothetical protein
MIFRRWNLVREPNIAVDAPAFLKRENLTYFLHLVVALGVGKTLSSAPLLLPSLECVMHLVKRTIEVPHSVTTTANGKVVAYAARIFTMAQLTGPDLRNILQAPLAPSAPEELFLEHRFEKEGKLVLRRPKTNKSAMILGVVDTARSEPETAVTVEH